MELIAHLDHSELVLAFQNETRIGAAPGFPYRLDGWKYEG